MHAWAERVSHGEIVERAACHQGYDGEPSPSDAPLTCRKPECRAEAIQADHVSPRVIAVGQNLLLPLEPVPLMQEPRATTTAAEEHREQSPVPQPLLPAQELERR